MKKENVRIEFSKKPWFGPRKRAKECLRARTNLLSHEETLKILDNLMQDNSDSIQAIRFIDFTHQKDGFHYTIALIWCFSNSEARNLVYGIAEQMVQLTGWYPLPQGERIGSRLAKLKYSSKATQLNQETDFRVCGSLRSVCSAVPSYGGCSIRVYTDEGDSFLLDSGLPNFIKTVNSDKVVFISHLHTDHIGGIENWNNNKKLPIVVSEKTLQILNNQKRLLNIQKWNRVVPINSEMDWKAIGNYIEFKTIQVPHAPGSVGYIFRDDYSALFFTGDIVLQTYRHDFFPQINQLIEQIIPRKLTFLIDSTMAARSAGASQVNAAELMLNELTHKPEIGVLSRDSEQLLFAYLDLFHCVKEDKRLRHTVDFIMPDSLRVIFQILHQSFINRELASLDPILSSQYGASMSAWAESKFLYWLNENMLYSNHSQRKTLWFITPREIFHKPNLLKLPIALLGRFNNSELELSNIFEMDTSPWTLHSNNESLGSCLSVLQSEGQLILFHDFPKRLKKFIKESDFKALVLSKKQIDIGKFAV